MLYLVLFPLISLLSHFCLGFIGIGTDNVDNYFVTEAKAKISYQNLKKQKTDFNNYFLVYRE